MLDKITPPFDPSYSKIWQTIELAGISDGSYSSGLKQVYSPYLALFEQKKISTKG
jgi:hypothetical protein